MKFDVLILIETILFNAFMFNFTFKN